MLSNLSEAGQLLFSLVKKSKQCFLDYILRRLRRSSFNLLIYLHFPLGQGTRAHKMAGNRA